jgi:hypothetical protein
VFDARKIFLLHSGSVGAAVRFSAQKQITLFFYHERLGIQMKKTLEKIMSHVPLYVKMKRIQSTSWAKLTLGEKILKVIMTLVKWAAIIAVVVCIGGVVLAVVAGFAIALAIGGAVGAGFHNAGESYSGRYYGDRYYDDSYYHNRDIW